MFVLLSVKYTGKLADGTVFEKEGFGDELYEFITDEGNSMALSEMF